MEITDEEYERNNSISLELNGVYSYCFDNTEMGQRIDEEFDDIIFGS